MKRKYAQVSVRKPRSGPGVAPIGCLITVLIGIGLMGDWLLGSGTVLPESPVVSISASLDQKLEPTTTLQPPRDSRRVSVLVLGIDRRANEVCPCRSDVMMLASLDLENLTAGLITIPRDLWVPIPTVGSNRINTAMYYGQLNNYPGKGPGLAMATVEKNFNRPVQHYVVVDFGGFRRLVDTLGGINIDVPQAINDPLYPDENFGYKPLHIPSGLVHMNGEMALAYARTRHVDNDFGRSKRQIQVLMAMRERALRLDVIPRLPLLLNDLWGTVETDLSPQEILGLAQAASNVKPTDIKTASIDQTTTTEILSITGGNVLIPNMSKISGLIDQIIPRETAGVDVNLRINPGATGTRVPSSSPTIPVERGARLREEAARVLILNGTDTPGLAERTSEYLLGKGFGSMVFDNADRHDYQRTVLTAFGSAKRVSIDALASIFRIDSKWISFQVDPRDSYDIRIILGSDWKLPQQQTVH